MQSAIRRFVGVVTVMMALLPAATARAEPGTATAAVPPPVIGQRLPNGLRLLLAPDPALDDVSVVVRYGVGAADDPPGREGLAHLVEHLMFEGSKHVPRGGHFKFLQAAGAWGVNATTFADQTIYFETVPPNQLPVVLWLESDRMGYLADALADSDIALQHAIVIDEYRDRRVDNSGGALSAVLQNEIYPTWHPYRAAAAEETMAAPDRRDVLAFLRTWYSPSNATVIIAGHFDPAKAAELATRYFATLPSAAPPARPAIPAFTLGDLRLDLDVPAPLDVVQMIWKTPALGAPGNRELDVTASLLANPKGRPSMDLVKGGLATHLQADQQSMNLSSELDVRVVVAPGVSPEKVVSALESAVAALANGVGREAVADAEGARLRRQRFRLETSNGRAAWLAAKGDAQEPNFSPGPDVDATAVASAIRTYLIPSERATIVLHRKRGAPPQGEVTRRERRLP